ncbi:GNAT family N-acetyltransferase [Rhodococcus chondri]|uniref:GNAT family N-acetyltransferase n=1 Tax=Rhodococcus chondri TaxID=3065941 RepID=A0ABU7JPJ3_9NOCA|nr:GNAT family N-acetyltransferase [Rhodococcus sp. CC-R104]MEE2031950.1 GNAT family N-acetyltransferase [Rhodococcus sp. CC-R104]
MDIVDSRQVTPAQLGEFYDAVLAPSFPLSELAPRAELLAGLHDPAGAMRAALAVAATGEIIGGAVGEWFPDCRVLLVTYLATRPGQRGGGVGREVLRAVMAQWRRSIAPLLVVGEVEDPRHHRDNGFGDPVRRLRFYASEGAEVIDVPYFQPALRSDGDRVRNLLLMTFAVDPACRRDDGVDSATVRCFLERNLEGIEGHVGDDPETTALWAALAAPTVPLLDPRPLLL